MYAQYLDHGDYEEGQYLIFNMFSCKTNNKYMLI